jgi:hypothetical protein
MDSRSGVLCRRSWTPRPWTGGDPESGERTTLLVGQCSGTPFLDRPIQPLTDLFAVGDIIRGHQRVAVLFAVRSDFGEHSPLLAVGT